MLDGLFKSNEEKQKEELEKHFALGLQRLQDKFYNQAMIEFKKALEISHDEAYPRLMKELENFSSSGDLEATLAIGLNVLQDNPNDCELANKLGNYARELENYEQARNLYKMALKANKGFEKAFYNLAACDAKVDLYDEAAKSCVEQFESMTDYILPEYLGAGNPADKYQEALMAAKQKHREEELQRLKTEMEQKKELGNMVEAGQIEFQITQLKRDELKTAPEEVLQALRRAIERDPESPKELRYNTGLYALSLHRGKDALWAFSTLKKEDFDKVPLLTAMALDYDGKLDDAINEVTKLLGENEFNRYNNVNLGYMFKKAGKRYLAIKYFIKTAYLLERSGGLYSMRELLTAADTAFAEGNRKKAYNFYKIASTEIKEKEIWAKLGEILIDAKKYDEAVETYREMAVIDPQAKEESNTALKKIHDYYAEKGDSLMGERKFKPSLEYFRKALSVQRLIETLEKAARVCRELNLPDEASQYLNEIDDMKKLQREANEEAKRLEILKEARNLAKAKQFHKAAEKLETAFRMKLDKQVFLQLASLYKGLKRVDELNSLIERWGKMVEHSERMAKYEKDQKRERQGNDHSP